jgi:hypothetical protein
MRRNGTPFNKNLALTVLEARFVNAVAGGAIPAQAVKDAGYASKTHNSVKAQASRLMAKPEIKEAIRQANNASLKLAEIDTAQVLNGIGKIAFADIRGLVNEDGTMKSIKDLPEELARAISQVRIGFDKQGNPQFDYKLEGRTKALELLANIAKITNGGGGADAVKTISDLVKASALLGAAAERGRAA